MRSEVPSIAGSLNNLGNVAYVQDDYASARSLYEESLAIKRELGDKLGVAGCLEDLARPVAQGREWERATRLWGAAAALREAISIPQEPQRHRRASHPVHLKPDPCCSAA